MSQRRSCSPLLLLLAMLGLAALVAAFAVPTLAEQSFGRPISRLSAWQKFDYGLFLLSDTGDLMTPIDPSSPEQAFVIQPGETVVSVSDRLQADGLIRDTRIFRVYLIWRGLDTTVQAGTYQLSAAMSGIEIAQVFQDATPDDVEFNVWPGWRVEEIAATLPTSGLEVTPEAFLAAAKTPANLPDFIPTGATAEGFLFPDGYTLARVITADQLVSAMVQDFTEHLTSDLQSGFASHGLNVYQAVTLASIVQREALVEEEMPVIASVFYNRLAIGMKLESDPTVQYALGYDDANGTWWSPLSLDDLRFDSPYNTYLYPNWPPGPISNPGLAALQAVAFPSQTPYYFFVARCDASGLHNFSVTFEEQLQYLCP